MDNLRIVDSVTEINPNHFRDEREENRQEVNEFVNEMLKKYEEKEQNEAYERLCYSVVNGKEESYWERKIAFCKKHQKHLEEMQEKKVAAKRIQQDHYFRKLAQQKRDNGQLLQPCTEEGQLLQFSVAELIFGEEGIL